MCDCLTKANAKLAEKDEYLPSVWQTGPRIVLVCYSAKTKDERHPDLRRATRLYAEFCPFCGEPARETRVAGTRRAARNDVAKSGLDGE